VADKLLTKIPGRQIKTADYSFPSPYWDEVSDDAKDLIMKIFQVDPKARFRLDPKPQTLNRKAQTFK
jgi:hypothetical protein